MSPNRPARNVLLIVVDQWRWDLSPGLGLPHVATPALDALAARGTVFTRHFAQSVPCGPARATMATGQYPFTHRVFSNPVPLSAHHRQLQHHLRDAGVTPWMIGYTTSVPDPRGRNPADPAFTGPSVAEGWRVVREMAEDKSNYMAWARNRQADPGPAPDAAGSSADPAAGGADDYDLAFANHLRAGAPVEASPRSTACMTAAGWPMRRWMSSASNSKPRGCCIWACSGRIRRWRRWPGIWPASPARRRWPGSMPWPKMPSTRWRRCCARWCRPASPIRASTAARRTCP
ncbi:sulfatase-like hydrolase/transferase [Tistrella bauzanensis]